MVKYKFKNCDMVTVNREATLSNDVKENLDRIGNVELFIHKDITTPDIRYVVGRKIKDDGEIYDYVIDADGYLIKFYPTDLKLIEHGKLNYVPEEECVLVRNVKVNNYNIQDGYNIGKVVIASDYFPNHSKGVNIIYNATDAFCIEIDGVAYYQVEIDDIKGIIS